MGYNVDDTSFIHYSSFSLIERSSFEFWNDLITFWIREICFCSIWNHMSLSWLWFNFWIYSSSFVYQDVFLLSYMGRNADEQYCNLKPLVAAWMMEVQLPSAFTKTNECVPVILWDTIWIPVISQHPSVLKKIRLKSSDNPSVFMIMCTNILCHVAPYSANSSFLLWPHRNVWLIEQHYFFMWLFHVIGCVLVAGAWWNARHTGVLRQWAGAHGVLSSTQQTSAGGRGCAAEDTEPQRRDGGACHNFSSVLSHLGVSIPRWLFFSAQNLNINNTSHSLPLRVNLACMLMNDANTSHIQRRVKCVALSFCLSTCSVLTVGELTDICSGNWWNGTCSWQGALWAALERSGEGRVNELHTLDNIWPLQTLCSCQYCTSAGWGQKAFCTLCPRNFLLLCSVVRFRPSWAKHKKRRGLWSCSCRE